MPVPTIDRPVSALRQRMMEDMAMRGLRSDTQHEYIRFVRSFAAFLRQPPDTATAEDIRRFQVHQRESGVQPPTINCSVSALRFFFTVTLDRPDLSRRLVLARYPRPRLPRLLLGVRELGLTAKASCQEVARHLRRVNFDVASYINDKRATVEFSKRVAGAMARRAARIAYERAGGK